MKLERVRPKDERLFFCEARALTGRIRRCLLRGTGVVAPIPNRTIVNWCSALVRNGFLLPDTSGQRIRSYEVTALAKDAGDAG